MKKYRSGIGLLAVIAVAIALPLWITQSQNANATAEAARYKAGAAQRARTFVLYSKEGPPVAISPDQESTDENPLPDKVEERNSWSSVQEYGGVSGVSDATAEPHTITMSFDPKGLYTEEQLRGIAEAIRDQEPTIKPDGLILQGYSADASFNRLVEAPETLEGVKRYLATNDR